MNRKRLVSRVAAAFVCLIALVALAACGKPSAGGTANTGAVSGAASGGDVVITKSDITDQAKFIPYESDGVKMEVIAVKAPDGTIRTAMNTCQVCYDSGRGYYVQQGDTLVCQNCGNQFKISQIEKQKNGCNPVPILEGDKTDDGAKITISANYLEKNKELFANWKTN